MAAQDAKRFLEALEADQGLAEEVRAEIMGAEESTLEAYVAAAKGRDFDFTADEFAAELKARRDAAESA